MTKKPKVIKQGSNLIVDTDSNFNSTLSGEFIVSKEVSKQLDNIELVVEKDTTAWNKQQEEEEKLQVEKDKLPIDKLIEIANKNGLMENLTEEQKFAKFVKGIKLHDILKDCLQSCLNEYAKEYNKVNPEDNFSAKFHLRNKKNLKTGIVFSTDLVLEVKRRGLYKVHVSKNVSFTHIGQVRDEASWKYALYGSMMNALIGISLNHLLLTDDVNSGRIKSTISK